jgi:hypothetical protein
MFHADIVVPLVDAPAGPDGRRLLASRPFETLRECEEWLSRNRLMWKDALLENETRFQMLVTDADGELALLVEHGGSWEDHGVRYSRRALRALRGQP